MGEGLDRTQQQERTCKLIVVSCYQATIFMVTVSVLVAIE